MRVVCSHTMGEQRLGCACDLECLLLPPYQLSLALADLALQSNWLTAVMDTIQTFHDSLPKVLVMLDVLKYLPEEVSTGV